MLACMLVFALTLGPAPEPAAGELPHWRSAPEPPSERPSARPLPKVPSDGSGMITLGSLLLGTGGTLGLMSIGLTVANEPNTRSGRETAAFVSAAGLGAGTVFMTLGLVIRQRCPMHRARAAA